MLDVGQLFEQSCRRILAGTRGARKQSAPYEFVFCDEMWLVITRASLRLSVHTHLRSAPGEAHLSVLAGLRREGGEPRRHGVLRPSRRPEIANLGNRQTNQNVPDVSNDRTGREHGSEIVVGLKSADRRFTDNGNAHSTLRWRSEYPPTSANTFAGKLGTVPGAGRTQHDEETLVIYTPIIPAYCKPGSPLVRLLTWRIFPQHLNRETYISSL